MGQSFRVEFLISVASGFAVQYNSNDAKDAAAKEGYIETFDKELVNPRKLEEGWADSFDAIFLVGGYGPMQDMAVDPNSGALLAATLDSSKEIVAAVCHGPAGFISPQRLDGTWLFKDRTLAGFSNKEETQSTFAGNTPWLLEDRLRLAVACYASLPAWTPHVIVDGNFITGQQQVSAGVTADAVLKAMNPKG